MRGHAGSRILGILGASPLAAVASAGIFSLFAGLAELRIVR
jgi:hypothetical protein